MPERPHAYRHLWDFTTDMKALVGAAPGVRQADHAQPPSLEGRPVEGIEIANDVGAATAGPVFLQMGVHHAREWPSAEMPMEWAFDLVQGLVDGDARNRSCCRMRA